MSSVCEEERVERKWFDQKNVYRLGVVLFVSGTAKAAAISAGSRLPKTRVQVPTHALVRHA